MRVNDVYGAVDFRRDGEAPTTRPFRKRTRRGANNRLRVS